MKIGPPQKQSNSSLPKSALNKQRLAIFFVLCLPIAFLLSNCETLTTRLEQNQETLQSLPPEHQKNIREGKIQVGFTPVEVYLAWGSPDRKALTESTQGSLETWIYTQTYTETNYRRQRVYNSNNDRWEYIDKPFQVYSRYIVREVVFINGKVDEFTLFPVASRPF